MVKIIQYRNKCIGCGACVATCPKFWEMANDGKANLKEAKKNDSGDFELEAEDVFCNQEAASACPVQIIKIKK